MSKRRWFSFHLSTLLVAVLVAGVVLWLNMPRIRAATPNEVGSLAYRHRANYMHWQMQTRGWPLQFAFSLRGSNSDGGWKELSRSLYMTERLFYLNNNGINKPFFLDLFIAAAIVGIVTVLSEWTVRRREARRE